MKLNKEGKNELRKIIEEQLKEVPEGKRIHLDKELLESLIFDTFPEKINDQWGDNAGKCVKVKYIVWSGNFLSKIDLSEVSFDDVMWHLDYDPDKYFIEGTKYHYDGIESVDLSNTNAIILFDESFDWKYIGCLFISNCNFANVDLSYSQIICDSSINNCDFSNTDIGIDFGEITDSVISNTDLSANDFGQYEVDELYFLSSDNCFINNCNLINTGLNIKTTEIPDDIIDAYKILEDKTRLLSADEAVILRDKVDKYLNEIHAQQVIGEQVALGRLNGCYINDKKILSKDENQKIAQEKLTEYEKYKQQMFESVLKSIKLQKRKMKERK